MSTTTDTSWIKPGAEVVVYSLGTATAHPVARRDRIARVATKSFTTETGDRYQITRAHRRVGDAAWGYTEYVVPVDSETGQAELAKQGARDLMDAAQAAVYQWQRYRTREARLAAIAALQAVED